MFVRNDMYTFILYNHFPMNKQLINNRAGWSGRKRPDGYLLSTFLVMVDSIHCRSHPRFLYFNVMNDNRNSTQNSVITEYTQQLLQEFKEIYDPGQIPEVLEMLKDIYSSNTEDSQEDRHGIISMMNHIRELCNSIVPATPPAA